MSVVATSLQYTVAEWAYLCAHEGFTTSALLTSTNVYVATAIPTEESQRISGAYRPNYLNLPPYTPNGKGGDDISGCMINSKSWPVDDPFARFDTLTQIRTMFSIVSSQSTVASRQFNGWWPWRYGIGVVNQRPDIHLDVITAQVGLDPYNISKSPYWRMVDAGVDVAGLPIPPKGAYVSRLPRPPLKPGVYAPNTDEGDRVHQLGVIIKEDGYWVGSGPWWSYGKDPNSGMMGGVMSEQRRFQGLGLWPGPIDGFYTEAFHAVWDGALEFAALVAGH
jgi:hypothetical protein